MKYFQLLRSGIETINLMNLLLRNPQLWNADRVRTTFPGSSHAEASDILLRWGENSIDAILAWDRDAMKVMSPFKAFAVSVLTFMGGVQLGRVIITRLAPGGKIAPHVDGGANAAWYTRTHLVLQGKPGNRFTVEDETVEMKTGELWWFENKRQHACVYESKDDRVHLIIDIRIE
jgi:hypothetical protein